MGLPRGPRSFQILTNFEALFKSLGPSWAPLGPSRGFLGDLFRLSWGSESENPPGGPPRRPIDLAFGVLENCPRQPPQVPNLWALLGPLLGHSWGPRSEKAPGGPPRRPIKSGFGCPKTTRDNHPQCHKSEGPLGALWGRLIGAPRIRQVPGGLSRRPIDFALGVLENSQKQPPQVLNLWGGLLAALAGASWGPLGALVGFPELLDHAGISIPAAAGGESLNASTAAPLSWQRSVANN